MLSPMLCKPWDGQPKPGQWIAEPKIDGVRALVEIDSFGASSIYSRNGLPLSNWLLIKRELKTRNIVNVVLDGEIWDGVSFDTTSAIMRTQYIHPDQQRLRYYVFDVIVPGVEPILRTRQQYLDTMLSDSSFILGRVTRLPRLPVKNNVPWELYIKGFHKMGFEGAVFKELGSVYEYKRSGLWLKAKPTYEADLLIIGMNPGKEGKYSHTLGALVVAGEVECKGQSFQVQCAVSGMDDTMRDWFWERREDPNVINKLIVQVEFQDVTKDFSLRFPRVVRTREDKS